MKLSDTVLTMLGENNHMKKTIRLLAYYTIFIIIWSICTSIDIIGESIIRSLEQTIINIIVLIPAVIFAVLVLVYFFRYEKK
jgi:hypothetical protein